jgi:hypothetical protein
MDWRKVLFVMCGVAVMVGMVTLDFYMSLVLNVSVIGLLLYCDSSMQ